MHSKYFFNLILKLITFKSRTLYINILSKIDNKQYIECDLYI